MRSCNCEAWLTDYNGIEDSAPQCSFLFCPWCGVRLNAPCANCGEPSNKNTGNTLYWQDEENYCSVECGLKMVKGGSAA